jgi:hypothetical protein
MTKVGDIKKIEVAKIAYKAIKGDMVDELL